MNQNNLINLTWELISSEKDAREDITNLQNIDKSKGDESSDLIDIFNEDYVPFEKDKDLKWDKNHPLVIKWKIRINTSKDIQDVVIDKDYSVLKSYQELMEAPIDDVKPYDYTLDDEIINAIRTVLIEEYENEIPFKLNELFSLGVADEVSFGFDLYQLNAVESDGGEVSIIDASSAIKNKVFDKIKANLQSRIKIQTVE